jgi:putative membrane protein
MTSKLTWLLLSSTVIFSSAILFFQVRDVDRMLSLDSSKMLLPVALALLHASITFSQHRGLVLVFLGFMVGLAFESVGVRSGFVFGGHYVYNIQASGPTLLDVPLIVPLYWSVFIYLGYSITTSFLVWGSKEKPSVRRDNAALLPLLVVLDGLIVVAIDVFLDPLMVFHNKWFWPDGGPFFDIPIGNFVAWFLIVVVTTGAFRVFEWRFPQQPKRVDTYAFIAPVVAYAALCGVFAALAIDANLHGLLVIGAAAMMPVVGLNLFCFLFCGSDSEPGLG